MSEREGSSTVDAPRPQDSSGDIHVLAARNAQAAAFYRAGRTGAAASLFEQVHRECGDLLGADHDATLAVVGNLGVALFASGSRARGIRLMAANLADRVRVWGDEDPRTLVARDALAVGHRLAGDVDEGVAVSRQVAEQRWRVLGPTHLDTLTSRMGLALAHAAAGDVGAAVTELTTAISDSERTHGSRHPHTAALIDSGRRMGLVRRAS